MKNNSNIYDIDGDLIRGIDDVHTWTIEEAQAKIDKYTDKLKELEENDPNNPKMAIYRTYIVNLHRYLFELYAKMSPEEIQTILNTNKTKEQINNAINELKKEIENEAEHTSKTNNEPERTEDGAEVGEERTENQSRTQDDLLVSGEGRPETVMDEYVDFEEI